MKEQIKLWGIRIIILLLVLVVGRKWGVPVYTQYFTKKAVSVYIPTAKVKYGQFTVSFHEMGALMAEKSVAVTVDINGKLIYLVSEGAIVKPGTKLAEVDTSDLQREVLNQQLAYNNTLADVDRANAELDILKKQNETDLAETQAQFDFDTNELALAKERLTRKQSLYTDKLVTRSDVDQAEGEVRSKEFTVKKGAATLKLKVEEISNKEAQKSAEVRNIKFRTQMAKRSLDESQRRVDKAIVNAPAPGMVVLDTDWGPDGRRKLQAGDSVRPQQTILSLPDLTSMQVKIALGEADAPKVAIGLPVLIRLEAVPKRVFHGSVKSVASLATEPSPWERTGNTGKTFEVIIAVKEVEPKTLKPGMTVDAEFIRKSVAKAMYVPLEAIVEGENKTFVYVKNGSGWRKQVVKLGISNDNFVCVSKGLTLTDVVALRDPTKPIDEQNTGASASSGDETSSDKTKPKTAVPIPDSTKK